MIGNHLKLGVLSLLGLAFTTTSAAVVKSLVQRVIYEYGPVIEEENCCLQNEFDLIGGKVVLINLDDRCEVARYVEQGVFIQTGDFVILTGREMPGSDLFWTEVCNCNCCEYFDESIVRHTEIFDSPIVALPCYNQPFFVL
jgi:hypothetical protein